MLTAADDLLRAGTPTILAARVLKEALSKSDGDRDLIERHFQTLDTTRHATLSELSRIALLFGPESKTVEAAIAVDDSNERLQSAFEAMRDGTAEECRVSAAIDEWAATHMSFSGAARGDVRQTLHRSLRRG
jgi:hypothetical protein